MAKIRKCKLSWEASPSERVVGYKLYWSKGPEVSYDSKSLKIGNVTEIILPDDVTLSGGPVMFGITAVDRDGNESDMVTIAEPYQLHVPEAPAGISIQLSDDFKLVTTDTPQGENLKLVNPPHPEVGDDEDPLAQAIEDDGAAQVTRVKYYDDIGYRRTP